MHGVTKEAHWITQIGNLINYLFIFSFDHAIQLDSNFKSAWNGKGYALTNLEQH